MITEDIAIPRTGEYVLIEIATTQMTITNISEVTMWLRFGSSSISKGIPLKVDKSAIVDTDVYIAAEKAVQYNIDTKVAVTR